jgi:GAF domain-containing protein
MDMTQGAADQFVGPTSAKAEVHTRENVAADHVNLQASLSSLARLAAGQGQRGLEDMLSHVAGLAVQAIPGADGAGLTVLQDGLADTIVGSADFVRAVDADQYRIGEGPCITAATEARTVMTGSIGTEGAFPRFGPLAAGLGVHSVLSLPLQGSDGVVGSLNVYAHAENAYDSHAIELGELFAAPAAIAVQNAQALAQSRRLATTIQIAVASRATVDRAIGILLARFGCTAEQALQQLRDMSQAQNRDLILLAQDLLDGAVLKSRSAQTGD